MITGNPVSRRVVPLVPPLLSYSSTCSRTQSRGLGTYLAMALDLHIAVGNLLALGICAKEKIQTPSRSRLPPEQSRLPSRCAHLPAAAVRCHRRRPRLARSLGSSQPWRHIARFCLC